MGRIFEVTPDGRIVWEYVSPYEGWISRGGGAGNWVFRALRYAAGLSAYCGTLAVVMAPARPSYFQLISR